MLNASNNMMFNGTVFPPLLKEKSEEIVLYIISSNTNEEKTKYDPMYP